MPEDDKKSDIADDGRTADNLGVILKTMGDTTWRMFVPTALFTLLGVWLDSQFGAKPWLMIIGIALGALGAVLLVRRQLVNIKRSR